MEQNTRKDVARLKDYLKIARLDHWIKQLFVIPGFLFAVMLVGITDFKTFLWRFVLGFMATCFIASANYVINEWLDAEFDKFHPVKKIRPAVGKGLSAKIVYTEYMVLAFAGLLLGWFCSLQVFVAVLALLVMGIIYNVKPMRSKDIPYLDVISESVNNAIRLLIGWFMVTDKYLPPITIVIGFWMGGAFLMATKRYAEYRMIGDKETAGIYRRSFKKYSEQSLLVSAFFYALVSVFACGIFMIKYRIELLIAVIPMCALFAYYLNISYKADSAAQKPEKLFREKGLMILVLIFIAITMAMMFIDIPSLNELLETTLLGA